VVCSLVCNAVGSIVLSATLTSDIRGHNTHFSFFLLDNIKLFLYRWKELALNIPMVLILNTVNCISCKMKHQKSSRIAFYVASMTQISLYGTKSHEIKCSATVTEDGDTIKVGNSNKETT
jgi:hypothetical protein